MARLLAWQRPRYLAHPDLEGGRLLVAHVEGRWVPLAAVWGNGFQEDGLEALCRRDLCLRNPFHPVPKILRKSE